jgi:hypothetical protein
MPLAHGPSHQFSDDGALVLIAEGLVEFRLHFIRHTEIDGCHSDLIVEIFNNETIRRPQVASMAISAAIRRFFQSSC